MKENRMVILHVFSDGVIFSGMADYYDSMQDVTNLYYYYSPDTNFCLKSINDERVRIIHDFDEYVNSFRDPEVDIILFYSLPYRYYYLFDYIDDSKFVIWWAWGYDMYYRQGNYPPLLSLGEMYKPLTKSYMARYNSTKLSSRIINCLKRVYGLSCHHWTALVKGRVLSHQTPRPRKTQNEILARIDSFYAPLDIEYNYMLKTHSCFHAIRNPRAIKQEALPFKFSRNLGNILINHSLTYTDNHLDVFDYLKDIVIGRDRKFIIPISYGIDGFDGKPEKLIQESPLDNEKVTWLTEILPLKEYERVLETVSHAVFGALRQQALGNIYRCLKSGTKIYLFQDSIIYKELKRNGYILFTIEKDLSSESLSTPLSEHDAKLNYDIYMAWLAQNSSNEYHRFLCNSVLKCHN